MERKGGRTGSVHVFREPWQPATMAVDHNTDPPMLFEHPPRALIHCRLCRRRRWAEFIEVQLYYDAVHSRCKAGHGCRKDAP